MKSLADLRKTYARESLSKSAVDPDPIVQFRTWMNEALDAQPVSYTHLTLPTNREV